MSRHSGTSNNTQEGLFLRFMLVELKNDKTQEESSPEKIVIRIDYIEETQEL